MTALTNPAGSAARWVEAHAAAVTALTAAARLRHPDGDRIDFADLLASALASAAVNVGGADALIAGRPGSWEAAKVFELVTGTIGWDGSEGLRYRTEPIVVRVCVAEVAELDYGLPGMDHAVAAVEEAHADLPEDEQDAAQWQADIASAETRYRNAFTAYGQAFATAVQAKAAEWTELTAPVVVEVDDDPDTCWWEPAHQDWTRPTDEDDLAAELARHAHATVPAPNLAALSTTTPAPPADPNGGTR
jgi:hypothetical protein